MTRNEYPHFNPTKYGISSKIATVKSGLHSKYNINYHIIWIPKYRKKVLCWKSIGKRKAFSKPKEVVQVETP